MSPFGVKYGVFGWFDKAKLIMGCSDKAELGKRCFCHEEKFPSVIRGLRLYGNFHIPIASPKYFCLPEDDEILGL